MKKNKIQRGVGLCLLLVFLLPGCEGQPGKPAYPLSLNSQTMGTTYSVKVSILPEGVTQKRLAGQIEKTLARINHQMSTYEDDSELSLFNRSRSTQWQTVSESLYKVLSEAYKISEATEGAFDVTVGPLVNLWGFGPDPMSFKAPPEAEIDHIKTRIGFKQLKLKDDSLEIKKEIPDLYVDLSAIAKGFAVDKIAELLEINGITNYLVEIGGEIRLKGVNLNGDSWRIAVEKPTPELRMIQKIVPLTNIAMATSGDYRNFFEINNIRFSHTIDPRSGRPITHSLASVTVLRETSMEADALATAFMVLGPELAYQFAEQNQIAALFIIKSDQGFTELNTAAFSKIIEATS